MNALLQSLTRLFCYCGLTKQEYLSVRKDAYVSNFNVWKYLHIFIFFGYAVWMVAFGRTGQQQTALAIECIMMVYSLVVTVLFFLVLQEDALISQLVIYLSMSMTLLSVLLIALTDPESTTTFFPILLVLLSMFMIDKPYYMAIFTASAVVIFLHIEAPVVASSVFVEDRQNAIFFGLLGILINLFYNRIRFNEFLLRKQRMDLYEGRQVANRETSRLNTVLKKMSESAVELLGDVVEGRNAESGEHVKRVKGYTYILANRVMEELPEYGLDPYTVDLITFTSSLHDVGKISIPDSILCKPGRLTPEEFEIMKQHCDKGCLIIEKMADSWSEDYLDMGIAICRNHHEKWDGKGYPRGLKGDEIPIAAQIVSIADIYDALTNERVYKAAYSKETAYSMIKNGECGAFSEKLLRCFEHCREQFEQFSEKPDALIMPEREYEIVSNTRPNDSFVIGLHNETKTLQEKARLNEEVSVLGSLSEEFFYVCYVDMQANEIIRFKADKRIKSIADTFDPLLKSNQKFDKLLNTIVVNEDYDQFRHDTDRDMCVRRLKDKGHLTTDFRIRLEDGVHYCRMKITIDPRNENAVIIGILDMDEEHQREMAYQNMQTELEIAKREIENQEKLADRIAVIDCISSEYDYVCTLNADTMDVVVYRAVPWISDMFKNLTDLVKSPEVRNKTLKGIIYDEDFERFQFESRHECVLRGLSQSGQYFVNYRAYKYGKLVNYQTRYTLDKNNPKRIVIGLHSV